MSRARKRVWITYRNVVSQFIQDDKVLHHFEEMNEGKLEKLMKFEDNFVRFDDENE
jgi:hypothetical protein